MAWTERQEVERKAVTILRILKDAPEPLGSTVIAQRLRDHGVELQERAVRYHLKIMDERGYTRRVGRDGRVITDLGAEELRNALVSTKVGFVISKIELLAFRTTFDWERRTGVVPVNVSLIPKARFKKALEAMAPVFKAGICVSELVSVLDEGERIDQMTVPPGKVAFATVCSIIINGALLKAGIPMDSKFGGILQVRNRVPLRFVELIQYSGSSLDPSTIFLRSRMTSVREVARKGEGNLLANFREIPAVSKPVAQRVIAGLKDARLGGLVTMGDTSQPVCEIPVELNKIGMILLGGLTPVAAAMEAGIELENAAMSGVMEYGKLRSFWDLL